MDAHTTMQEYVASRTESQLAMQLPSVSKELDGTRMGLSTQSLAHHSQRLEFRQQKSTHRLEKWYGSLSRKLWGAMAPLRLLVFIQQAQKLPLSRSERIYMALRTLPIYVPAGGED